MRATTRAEAFLVLVAVVAGTTTAQVDAPSLVRAPLALLLVAWLPGRAIWAAVGPRARRGGVGERSTIYLGISLTCTVLTGLALNLVTVGARAETWGPALAGISIMGLLLSSTYRRGPAPREEQTFHASGRAVVSASIGVALMALAAVVLAVGIRDQPQPRFTELWLLPAHEHPGMVDIGIHDAEGHPIGYRLTVLLWGATRRHGSVISSRRWPVIHLASGATWTTTVPAGARHMSATLFRPGDSRPYRSVTLGAAGQ